MAKHEVDCLKMREEWGANDAVRDAGLTIPDYVTRYVDIPYGPEPKWNLMDIYRPKDVEGMLPVIVSMHGGGYFYGDKELYQYYCMSLTQFGFAVVNYNYRLAPENEYPCAIDDTLDALRFVSFHAEEYGLDMNNVFFVGDSAGAHLCHQVATLLTSKKYQARFHKCVSYEFKLRAVAINCGECVFPVTMFGPINALGNMRYGYVPHDWKKYRAEYKVRRCMNGHFPPTYVMGAANDALKICVPRLNRRLNKLGVPHTAKVYGSKDTPEIAHVFHVNQKLPLAYECNKAETDFFKEYIH